MSDTVVLYDLASKQNVDWNPNTWKSRLLLNYKGISYRTEFLEYPDVAPTFKALGIPPNAPGAFTDYTCPTIRLADGTCVMDSMLIVENIEELYPSKSVHLDAGLHHEADKIFNALLLAFVPDMMLPLVNDTLQEPSSSWFAKDRCLRFGVSSMEEFRAMRGGDAARPAIEDALKQARAFCTDHKKDEGPFILGSQLSYSDFMIAAFFECLARLDAKAYKDTIKHEEALGRLHEACRPWLERDD